MARALVTSIILGLLLTANVLAAGCLTDSEAQGAPPPPYRLTVEWIGYDNGTRPIANGLVKLHILGNKTQEARTDTAGSVQFNMTAGNKAQLEFAADGWTSEASARLVVPAPKSGTDTAADVIQGFFTAITCAATLGMACNSIPTVVLQGNASTVQFHAVRPTLTLAYDAPVPAHANAVSVSVPENSDWFPKPAPVRADETEQALYMAHLSIVRGQIRWTNAPPQVGDFELSYGCNKHQAGNGAAWLDPATDLLPGTFVAKKEWSPGKNESALVAWWSPTKAECPVLFAGPLVRRATTGMTTHVELLYEFGGRVQVPKFLEGGGVNYDQLSTR